MLATQRMGSYHGQDPTGLPFGCKHLSLIHLFHLRNFIADSSRIVDNDSIEGMAFPPDYRPRGPPPAPQGKPLLNMSDQEQLDGFFAGFDSNNLTPNDMSSSGAGMMPANTMASNEQPLTPQYFITSHTHMQGQPPFVDPVALEGGANMFNPTHMGGNMSMGSNNLPFNQMVQHTAHALPFANYPSSHNNSQDFFHPLAASMPSTFPVAWSHALPSTNMHSSSPRPLVRFGSDSHFGPAGYVPPLGSTELNEQNEMQRFEWLEGDAQSSAPNTQPNTQPSSPVWTRKRKAEGDQSTRAQHSNGVVEDAEPVRHEATEVEPEPISTRKRHKVTLKPETQTPFPTPQPHSLSSTTTKPSTRGKRKSHSIATSSPAQPLPTTTTTKPHPSPSASSSKPKRPSAISTGSGSGSGVRVPLTSDQKRANHTNSEQRRRDQAQKAFARLFDLVPELEQEGKLSQMKKLERVVRKMRELEEGNRECRRRIEKRGG